MHIFRPNHTFPLSVVSAALGIVFFQISALVAMVAFFISAGILLFALTPQHERQTICAKSSATKPQCRPRNSGAL